MSMTDKTVLVTGAARGLGKAIASRFIAEGANVLVTDNNKSLGEAAATELGADFLHHDVSSEGDWENVISYISDRWGVLHSLVNNAGFEGAQEARRDPEGTPLEDWEAVFRVNAAGAFLGCKHAIPLLAKSGGGAITNISSVASMIPMPFMVAYGASKAAVEHLTRSVALHCAEMKYSIRCNSVHPGQILTPMLVSVFDKMAADRGVDREVVQAEFMESIPLRCFQDASDIASMVYFLSGDESRMITGQAVAVDGGLCLVK